MPVLMSFKGFQTRPIDSQEIRTVDNWVYINSKSASAFDIFLSITVLQLKMNGYNVIFFLMQWSSIL